MRQKLFRGEFTARCFWSALVIGFAAVTASQGASRVALIIGNDQYAESPLQNAVRDAEAVRSMLVDDLGFPEEGIVFGRDIERLDFFTLLEEFSRVAENAEVSIIYYAGHGMESLDGKENFLIPVDADIGKVANSEAMLRAVGINLGDAIREIGDSTSGAKIVLLDCCRDRPSGRGTSRAGGGLNPYQDAEIPSDTMILLAAAPSRQASDGELHGPFTQALLETLPQEHDNLLDAFLAVGDRVEEITESRQVPWLRFDGSGRIFRESVLAAVEPRVAGPGHLRTEEPPDAKGSKWLVLSLDEIGERSRGTVELTEVFSDDEKSQRVAEAISRVEQDGWQFCAATSDQLFLFRERGNSTADEYRCVASGEMDAIGFRATAEENSLEIAADGTINFPKEMVDQIAKSMLMPKSISLVEGKDWEFRSVTSDHLYLFRRTHGGSSNSYRALSAQQMDAIGFRAVAEENDLEIASDGTINFPKELVDQIAKAVMLPKTISLVEEDGMEFVAVTSDNYYIFRQRIEGGSSHEAGYQALSMKVMGDVADRPRLTASGGKEEAQERATADADQKKRASTISRALRMIEGTGWKFCAVTSDDFFLFRKKKNQ